jgi:acyl-CoA thioester hydrolase
MSYQNPFPWHITFADTDSGGVVYYARYLEWAERARAAWLLGFGTSNTRLLQDSGIVFVVRECHAVYHASGALDDTLHIHTTVEQAQGARLCLLQRIVRDDRDCVVIRVTMACLGQEGRPKRIPDDLLQKLLGNDDGSRHSH